MGKGGPCAAVNQRDRTPMHPLAVALLRAAALVGHTAVSVWLFNRLHAIGRPRRVVKTLEKLLLLAAALALIWLCIGPLNIAAMAYVVLCCLALLAAIPYWLMPKLAERTPT